MKFNFKKGSATKPGAIHRRVLLTPYHTLYPYFYDQFGIPLKPEEIKSKFEHAPDEIKKLAADRKLIVLLKEEKKS